MIDSTMIQKIRNYSKLVFTVSIYSDLNIHFLSIVYNTEYVRDFVFASIILPKKLAYVT